MRYASAGAFRTALERRLLTVAEQSKVPLVRLRKLVTFDRLMARLVPLASDRWILKGAVALHFRVGPQFRGTRDLDLGRHDDEQAATADFRQAESVDLGDYFMFMIERTSKLEALVEGAAVRYHVIASDLRRPPYSFPGTDAAAPPVQWSAAYRRMAAEVGLEPHLFVGPERARAFLDPILSGAVRDDARWDPARRMW